MAVGRLVHARIVHVEHRAAHRGPDGARAEGGAHLDALLVYLCEVPRRPLGRARVAHPVDHVASPHQVAHEAERHCGAREGHTEVDRLRAFGLQAHVGRVRLGGVVEVGEGRHAGRAAPGSVQLQVVRRAIGQAGRGVEAHAVEQCVALHHHAGRGGPALPRPGVLGRSADDGAGVAACVVTLRRGHRCAELAADDLFAPQFAAEAGHAAAPGILEDEVRPVGVAAVEVAALVGVFDEVELIIVTVPVEDRHHLQRAAKGTFDGSGPGARALVLVGIEGGVEGVGAVVLAFIARLDVEAVVAAEADTRLPEGVPDGVVAAGDISVRGTMADGEAACGGACLESTAHFAAA